MAEPVPVQDGAEAPESVFVARQPVFDRQRDIWGYELLFRKTGTCAKAFFSDEDLATSKVIGDGYHLARPSIRDDFKVLINFPRKLFLEGAAFALPPELCVIELLESVTPEPDVLSMCDELRKAGYRIALDDYAGQPGFEPLLVRADIVKVDVLNLTPPRIIDLYNQLRPLGCLLLAEKVEREVFYDLCLKLGFDLFQGFFFSRPEVLPGKKLSAAESSKLRLLNEISRDDYDLKTLGRLVAQDLSISYRLLRYVNSVHFSRPYRVESIRQALTLVGQRQLAQWLRVTVLSDLDAARRARAATTTSVQRARFLESLSGLLSPPQGRDAMFMAGLFSLLDVLLRMPMEEALADLPLDEGVIGALVGTPGPVRECLEFVERFERAEWEAVGGFLEKHGLSEEEAGRLYVDALTFAREVLDPETEE